MTLLLCAYMYRMEEWIITNNIQKEEKYDSMVSLDYANQTEKVLKKYYYDITGCSDKFKWTDEKEIYDTLPTIEYIKNNKETIGKLIVKIEEFILEINQENSNIKECYLDAMLKEMSFKGLNPFLDKIIAIWLCRLFDLGEQLNSKEKFLYKWTSIIDNFNNEKDDEECFEIADIQEIDTSKLEIGMVVKNYKELCVLLNQEVKNGKSKKLQIEDFERYFDYEKAGQKFIITDIYDVPLSKEDKRKLGNKSVYVQCIEIILLQYLSKQKGYTKTFTKRNWWELLGFVNHKYNNVSPKQLEDLDYTITPFEIKHFYQRSNKKLEQILFSALNSLKNRKLLIYEVQTMIVYTDTETKKEKYMIALDEDKKRILQVERYVLKNVMGYEKMIQVFCRFRQNEFYQEVNARLNELYGWDHYYKQIKVIYTPEDIKEALPQIKINLQKELLNQKIIDFLNTNAEETYKKKREEYNVSCEKYIEQWWGEGSDIIKPKNSKLWKIPDTYVTAQKILTDELIRIGHRNMKVSFDEFIESNAELDDLFDFK